MLGQINLFVADMAAVAEVRGVQVARQDLVLRQLLASVDFYRLLEVEVPYPFEWPAGSGAQHVEIAGDRDCHLALDNHPQARIWNDRFDPDRGEGNAVVGTWPASARHRRRR